MDYSPYQSLPGRQIQQLKSPNPIWVP